MNDKEKIEYLMSIYGLTPSQFADRTGIQRASVSHILSNRNKPSLEILLKVYNAFPGISLNWLILGEGDAPVFGSCQMKEPAPAEFIPQQRTPAAIASSLLFFCLIR